MAGERMQPGDRDYLKALGDRVREARARRGMSRKILARDSGVSERYLAQLETGQGNASIILLRQVAQAMGLPLDDLVREGPERSIDLTLLIHFLERLPPADLAAARALVAERFGTTEQQARRRRIALIGLRGAGKSTLGRRLADQLGLPFVELDQAIEQEAGMELGEIFTLYGQAAYRRYERRCLEAVIRRPDGAVVATGGSLVSEPATFDLLLSSCTTIWLKAAPEEHMARVVAQGDIRPMADNDAAMDDLRRILAGRAPLYGKADKIVDTADLSVEESFAALLGAVSELVP